MDAGKMEGEEFSMDTEGAYPVLFIPKVCTTLETNCQLSENVFIHLNITSPDTEGNQINIYSGYCNIKIIDSNEINIRYNTQNMLGENIVLTEAKQIAFPAYNDSQVWIDPARSPYVYNQCDSPPLETYTISESHLNHITVKQNNTYITQNVYNYNEPKRSPVIEEEAKLVRKVHETVQADNFNLYEEDELACGVFLSQLSDDIINETEMRARDERKFIGLKTDNEALKQLMSTDVQSVCKQQKTILFLGHDSESGETIQNICINDPMLECTSTGEVETEVVIDAPVPSLPLPKKKYQCDKCKQIFDKLSAFKQHMVGSHRLPTHCQAPTNVKFMCTDCGKYLKSQEKFQQHCLGHGDPDLECNKCHKVFASKFTLRNHRKIHTRKYQCNYCTRSYSTIDELNAHTTKSHDIFSCDSCPFICDKFSELASHQDTHRFSNQSRSSESEYPEELFEEMDKNISDSPEYILEPEDEPSADSVIAKVMSNKIFDMKCLKMNRRYNKTCDVCFKKFDRIGDLKRHLIEHVIRSTLTKNPVNKYGVLNIRCEVCQEKVFNKIDRYKAHLREHAKLTIYKCTFCDKSFSDSSNFSKHKKIHGTTYLQCDLCQRKFNSKKMLIQHMEYHNKNGPVTCQYCGKIFHFESMLNKHIRCAHNNENTSKFKCRFCEDYFKTLKEKWDHEWSVHHVRKAIVDCLMCGSRFRKYSELKRHCITEHDTVIPPAKRLLKWKSKKRIFRS